MAEGGAGFHLHKGKQTSSTEKPLVHVPRNKNSLPQGDHSPNKGITQVLMNKDKAGCKQEVNENTGGRSLINNDGKDQAGIVTWEEDQEVHESKREDETGRSPGSKSNPTKTDSHPSKREDESGRSPGSKSDPTKTDSHPSKREDESGRPPGSKSDPTKTDSHQEVDCLAPIKSMKTENEIRQIIIVVKNKAYFHNCVEQGLEELKSKRKDVHVIVKHVGSQTDVEIVLSEGSTENEYRDVGQFIKQRIVLAEQQLRAQKDNRDYIGATSNLEKGMNAGPITTVKSESITISERNAGGLEKENKSKRQFSNTVPARTDSNQETNGLASMKGMEPKRKIRKTFEVLNKSIFHQLVELNLEEFKSKGNDLHVTVDKVERQTKVGFLLEGSSEQDVAHVFQYINQRIELLEHLSHAQKGGHQVGATASPGEGNKAGPNTTDTYESSEISDSTKDKRSKVLEQHLQTSSGDNIGATARTEGKAVVLQTSSGDNIGATASTEGKDARTNTTETNEINVTSEKKDSDDETKSIICGSDSYDPENDLVVKNITGPNMLRDKAVVTATGQTVAPATETSCVLKLLTNYVKSEGDKVEVDTFWHRFQCSFDFQAFWNFCNQTDCGRKILDAILVKHNCLVSLAKEQLLQGSFVFQILDQKFKKKSDVKKFMDVILTTVCQDANKDLLLNKFTVDPKLRNDVLETVRQTKELDCVWIEFGGEQGQEICMVCQLEHKMIVTQRFSDIVKATEESFKNHEETVGVDFMWHRVMIKFGYLENLNNKFPNLKINWNESKHALVLKGPRDEARSASNTVLEILGTAQHDITMVTFSPGCQLEIFTYPEMCDYINSVIPQVDVVWLLNHLTKKIHLFTKNPKHLHGIDKAIKGCVQERFYPVLKDHAIFIQTTSTYFAELKKKYTGRLVIHFSASGLRVTTADDIHENVDAAIMKILSGDRGNTVNEVFENHEETVGVDHMWHRVMIKFGYFEKVNNKFPNLKINWNESKNALVLKGPRDEARIASNTVLELLGTAQHEISMVAFLPGCQLDIFSHPEMCDYINSVIPQVDIVWFLNHLTKYIHIFAKNPKQLHGIDKAIKGCVQEKFYPMSKDSSKRLATRELNRYLEELMKQYSGRLVIQSSTAGLLVTTADDIYENVDATIREIISREGSADQYRRLSQR